MNQPMNNISLVRHFDKADTYVALQKTADQMNAESEAEQKQRAGGTPRQRNGVFTAAADIADAQHTLLVATELAETTEKNWREAQNALYLMNPAAVRVSYENALATAQPGQEVAQPPDYETAAARVRGLARLRDNAAAAVVNIQRNIGGLNKRLAQQMMAEAVENYANAANEALLALFKVQDLSERAGTSMFAAANRLMLPTTEGMSQHDGPGVFASWGSPRALNAAQAARNQNTEEMRELVRRFDQTAVDQTSPVEKTQ